MAIPSRRLHARYNCRLTIKVSSARLREPIEAVVFNLGMGGAFMRVRGTLDDPQVKLEVPSGREFFTIEGRVVRAGGPDPKDSRYTFYGVSFAMTERSEQKIKLLVDRVRSNTPGISVPMRDYWSI